jgi:hypothetical protein
MKLIVCGGREWTDQERTFAALDKVRRARPVDVLIAGCARGADSLAVAWATSRGVAHTVYRADWDGLGRRAEAVRNQQMLDQGKPDGVVAFPGGRGTADMVRRALEAGVPVWQPYTTKEPVTRNDPSTAPSGSVAVNR